MRCQRRPRDPSPFQHTLLVLPSPCSHSQAHAAPACAKPQAGTTVAVSSVREVALSEEEGRGRSARPAHRKRAHALGRRRYVGAVKGPRAGESVRLGYRLCRKWWSMMVGKRITLGLGGVLLVWACSRHSSVAPIDEATDPGAGASGDSAQGGEIGEGGGPGVVPMRGAGDGGAGGDRYATGGEEPGGAPSLGGQGPTQTPEKVACDPVLVGGLTVTELCQSKTGCPRTTSDGIMTFKFPWSFCEGVVDDPLAIAKTTTRFATSCGLAVRQDTADRRIVFHFDQDWDTVGAEVTDLRAVPGEPCEHRVYGRACEATGPEEDLCDPANNCPGRAVIEPGTAANVFCGDEARRFQGEMNPQIASNDCDGVNVVLGGGRELFSFNSSHQVLGSRSWSTFGNLCADETSFSFGHTTGTPCATVGELRRLTSEDLRAGEGAGGAGGAGGSAATDVAGEAEAASTMGELCAAL
jgi:hypothetical protein